MRICVSMDEAKERKNMMRENSHLKMNKTNMKNIIYGIKKKECSLPNWIVGVLCVCVWGCGCVQCSYTAKTYTTQKWFRSNEHLIGATMSARLFLTKREFCSPINSQGFNIL